MTMDLPGDLRLLDRSSTADRVAQVLRARIAAGELPPGTRLSERALTDGLGVSRNTLREAFRLLAHEHLLRYELHHGVHVRQLSSADVTDIYRVRRALECAGVRAAAGSTGGQGEVLEAVGAGELAAAAGDWAAVGTADISFHRAVAGLAGSARIDRHMDVVLAELRLAFLEMADPRAFHEPYLRRNRVIADLLTAGDLAGAETELLGYLDAAEHQILSRMSG
ncbi:DNA-binding GntR family transcriptional regulator [Longispora fulva]|uniref:DNA-binding GntR family transcriptional regulator n=1 Tax=Longispora fulva TaxID=619741 RepID=A0A8J7GGB8_9ACTN|nr:DNA-binding GntR family transcriptional regulator [Longispora fulva]